MRIWSIRRIHRGCIRKTSEIIIQPTTIGCVGVHNQVPFLFLCSLGDRAQVALDASNLYGLWICATHTHHRLIAAKFLHGLCQLSITTSTFHSLNTVLGFNKIYRRHCDTGAVLVTKPRVPFIYDKHKVMCTFLNSD